MFNARPQSRRRERSEGFVLLMAVIFLLICSILGVYAMSMTRLYIRIASAQQQRRVAFNAAEAGIQFGVNQLPDLDAYTQALPNAATYVSAKNGDPAADQLFFKQTTAAGYSQNFKYNWYRLTSTGQAMNSRGFVTVEGDVRYGPVPALTGYGSTGM